jgi:hypothetical protein
MERRRGETLHGLWKRERDVWCLSGGEQMSTTTYAARTCCVKMADMAACIIDMWTRNVGVGEGAKTVEKGIRP